MSRVNHTLHCNTPMVSVRDNRGLMLRNIAWYRHPDTPENSDVQITKHCYHPRGVLRSSADPRMYASGRVNIGYVTDLAGRVVRSRSVDAGVTVALSDAAGRPLQSLSHIRLLADGQDDTDDAVSHQFIYEDAILPGRLLAVLEQFRGEEATISERRHYAENTPGLRDLNLAGQCIRHYDTVGLTQVSSIAINGKPLSESRQLLDGVDNPAITANWQGTTEAEWQMKLESVVYTTLTRTDALGSVLSSTDAMGNVQGQTYSINGMLQRCWLRPRDGSERIIVKSLTCSAAGQKLREEQGNGVVITCSYEKSTQRLIRIFTARLTGQGETQKVLQDLRYQYDPVGNVLSADNEAEMTRYWRNQKVQPGNVYQYDSLYQLTSASGREMAAAGSQPHTLHDKATCTRYLRRYDYDAGGNLLKIQHRAAATNSAYSIEMTVSHRSNRAVLRTLETDPAKLDALFTPSGHQKRLTTGMMLHWNRRGELMQACSASGKTEVFSEHYRYNSESQRVFKSRCQPDRERTLYLPGLEIRSSPQEILHTLVMDNAGLAQVRMLCWEKGKPACISDHQLRYSYMNLTGSCGLEVDGEGKTLSLEEYYPYGGTAVWAAPGQIEAAYKTRRFSAKERDSTGLYYYGFRYYQPWAGRWLSADPAGTVDGLSLFRMCRNNPASLSDSNGLFTEKLFIGMAVVIAAALAYMVSRYRPQQLQSISNPAMVATWDSDTRNNQHILTHMVRGEHSDFYSRPAEEVLASRDIFSAALIDPAQVTEQPGRSGYRYTGAYAESGFIIEPPAQNIIATHDQDISFPTHIGKQGATGSVTEPYQLADTLTRPPLMGYAFTGKPFPRIPSYITMQPPDELLAQRAKAETLLPDPTVYRNEILIAGKPGVRIHENYPATEKVKVKGILIASEYPHGRVSAQTESRVERLRRANPHLPVYRLGNKQLETVINKVKRH